MFETKEHEKVAERAKRLSYKVCIKEMCENGDKIDYPQVDFDPKLPNPMYDSKKDVLKINPNFDHGAKAVIQFGCEMPHYFHRHLSNDAYVVSHNIKGLLKDKEEKTILRWEEGVAYRIMEKVFLRYVKNPKHFAINSKYVLPKVSVEVCIDEMLRDKRTLFDAADDLAIYFGKSGIKSKIVLAALEEEYKEDSYVGWKVVREMPTNVFKKLLKDKEAHKKVSGIQIKSLSQRISERLRLKR